MQTEKTLEILDRTETMSKRAVVRMHKPGEPSTDFVGYVIADRTEDGQPSTMRICPSGVDLLESVRRGWSLELIAIL